MSIISLLPPCLAPSNSGLSCQHQFPNKIGREKQRVDLTVSVVCTVVVVALCFRSPPRRPCTTCHSPSILLQQIYFRNTYTKERYIEHLLPLLFDLIKYRVRTRSCGNSLYTQWRHARLPQSRGAGSSVTRVSRANKRFPALLTRRAATAYTILSVSNAVLCKPAYQN